MKYTPLFKRQRILTYRSFLTNILIIIEYAFITYPFNIQRTLVEGARITYQDKICSNGVIHRIDHVLMPPVGTLVDLVSTDTELSTLLAAVQASGLAGALVGNTCFVYENGFFLGKEYLNF